MEGTQEQTATPVSGATADSGMPITLTSKAIEMTKKAIAEEGLNDHGLRIAVRGGGRPQSLHRYGELAIFERNGDRLCLRTSRLRIQIQKSECKEKLRLRTFVFVIRKT
mgnify:CR=1 FL=1